MRFGPSNFAVDERKTMLGGSNNGGGDAQVGGGRQLAEITESEPAASEKFLKPEAVSASRNEAVVLTPLIYR